MSNSGELHLSAIKPATSTSPTLAERTWTTVYDGAGLVTKEIQPGSVELDRTFDDAGRPLSETATGASGSRTFSYDDAGRMRSVSHPTATIDVEYDDRGLPTAVTGGAGNSAFTWNDRGELETRTDPAGTSNYLYDDAGRLAEETDPITGGKAEYGYDDAGRRTFAANFDSSLTGSPDVPVRWTGYDNYGRIDWDVLLPNPNSDPETMARSYDFDADGNVAATFVWGSSNPADAGFQWYVYNSRNELAEWWDTTATPTFYSYDLAGNRTSAGAISYQYDEQNRLTSAGSDSYTWTDRGTMASVTKGLTTTNLTFDVFGQNLTNGATTMAYDGLGRIASRDADPFTYSGLSIDPVDDGDWVTNHGLDGTVLSTMESGGLNARWAVVDPHRNVVGLREPTSGEVDTSTAFNPHGERINTTGSLNPTVGFQGDYTDPTSGEVWMGTRHYQPTTATFTSRDSYNGRLESPLSLNRYTYAVNNPLSNWDPTGMAANPNDDWGKFTADVEADLNAYKTREFLGGIQNGRNAGLNDQQISFFMGIHWSTVVEPNVLIWREEMIRQWSNAHSDKSSKPEPKEPFVQIGMDGEPHIVDSSKWTDRQFAANIAMNASVCSAIGKTTSLTAAGVCAASHAAMPAIFSWLNEQLLLGDLPEKIDAALVGLVQFITGFSLGLVIGGSILAGAACASVGTFVLGAACAAGVGILSRASQAALGGATFGQSLRAGFDPRSIGLDILLGGVAAVGVGGSLARNSYHRLISTAKGEAAAAYGAGATPYEAVLTGSTARDTIKQAVRSGMPKWQVAVIEKGFNRLPWRQGVNEITPQMRIQNSNLQSVFDGIDHSNRMMDFLFYGKQEYYSTIGGAAMTANIR